MQGSILGRAFSSECVKQKCALRVNSLLREALTMFMTLVYAIILLVNGFSHVPKTHLLKEYRPSKSLKNYTRKRQFFLLIGHQNVSQCQNTFFWKHMIRLKCSWEWSKACPSRYINPFPPRLSCDHVPIFVSRDEILWCYQSDESSLAELLPSTI